MLIALGILIAVILCAKNEQRLGLPKDTSVDLALWCVPLGVIGARLYYVAFSWQSFAQNPIRILYIWEGGLAIYGGIIGGVIGALLLSRHKRVPFLSLCDMVAPSLILAQAIGRWGNFFNGEAYGNPVTDAALQFFPYAVQVGNAWYQATFFYESVWDFAGFVFLWLIRKKQRPGDGIFLYFIFYGIGRFLIEGLRSDSLMLGNLRVSQVLSLILVIASIAVILIRRKKANDIILPN